MSEPLPQTQTPAPPSAPSTPAPAGAPTTPAPTSPTPVGVIGRVPTNAAELRALESQRSELSDQLTSAANRRESLVGELEKTTNPAARAGLEARIKLLDERILQLEADIASTGKLLSTARGTLGIRNNPGPAGGPSVDPGDMIAIVGILSVFVFFPLAVAYARNIWRRGTLQKTETELERQNADRLARLESAVDAIAIEMERVSEGQRFVTKLLAESQDRAKVGRGS